MPETYKKTSDGVAQIDRAWYYLLDFNDRDNWKTIENRYGKKKLHDLTSTEFQDLFERATQQDLENMRSQTT